MCQISVCKNRGSVYKSGHPKPRPQSANHDSLMKASPLLATAIIFCAYISAAEASLTYQIPFYPGEVDGWSLDGGSITTDGTLGPITTENLESWEFRLTSPAGSSMVSSKSGGVFEIQSALGDAGLGSLAANVGNLFLASERMGPDFGIGAIQLIFANQDFYRTDFSGQAIWIDAWLSPGESTLDSFGNLGAKPVRRRSITIIDGVDDPTKESFLLGTGFSLPSYNGANVKKSTLLLPDGPFSIASAPIPEPTTVLLIALGSGLLLFRRASRCPALLLALTIAGVFSDEAQASLTYQIPSYPGTYGGWSLDRGAITTDGTLGEISLNNIDSWEFYITTPAGSSAISSSDGEILFIDGSYDSQSATTSLYASQERLGLVSEGVSLSFFSLTFSTQGYAETDFAGQAVKFWGAGHPPGTPIGQLTQRFGNISLLDSRTDPTIYRGVLPSYGMLLIGESTVELQDGPLIIASIPVPEPTTVLLISLGSGLLLFRRTSRCPALLLALVVACVFAGEAQASLTYEIAPRPGEKDGWSFDGGIHYYERYAGWT